ncbi:polysaccharide pyruvyl transferase family protein [Arthrobacter sp.]|uniref:polysaccharide pyruvyl transferase family protein n=1 Tax=Arthrobacter sp. TaxID=1667 RepID=UPI002811D95D|nr:polysaccharide pyruvyl transferase family protein [Arthrobacter sp.]
MNRKPLYLVGPSGHPNFGDEFITASWLRFLAAERPDDDVWLDCPHPGSAQILFAGLHPRLHITNTLWRCAAENQDLPASELTERMMSLVTDLGSPSFDLGLLMLREAASLHLIGGGYINGMWAHHAALIYGMRAVHNLTGAPLYGTGLGLMPGLFDEPANRTLFDDFAHATARDAASSDAYGLAQTPDDAFLGIKRELGRNQRDGVFVCIQSDTADPGLADSAIATARAILEPMVAAGRSIHYVEAVPGADRVAFDRLAEIIPAENFLSFAEIWQQGLPLSGRQTWITTRFHFHLLAAAAGADGVALPVKPGYYDVKHQSLIDLGSRWSLGGGHANNSPEGAGSLALRLDELSVLKESEARELYGQQSPAPALRGPLTRFGRSAGRSLGSRLRR